MNAPLDRSGLQDVVAMVLRHHWATSDRIAVALVRGEGHGDWATYQLRRVFRNCRWRRTRKQRREVLSESRMREICLSGSMSHRAHGDLHDVAEIDHAVEAGTLAEPLRMGSKRNGNALLAAHVRLGTTGAAELRSLIEDRKAHGHLPVVQGFVWRARGMSEADAIAVSGFSTASGLIAAPVRLGCIGAVEAQAVLADLLPAIADLSGPVPPDSEIESFMPWVDAAAARQARAHLRLFAS